MASNLEAIDELTSRPSTVQFLREEYRESYPFRTAFEARFGLRRREIPTADFIRSFSQAPLKDSRLYELRVHHGSIARSKTAKALEQAAEKKATTRGRRRELTSAEQLRQLCDAMRGLEKRRSRTESKEARRRAETLSPAASFRDDLLERQRAQTAP
ncbi:unnamed protein product [Effrenium voratum]|uniref:Uncharacterized protein n=1 Tax=Effrenium voratum TaxID=2562239 RepID=A0AA36NLZ4_9DINO|nr:unnamed protein product [Effrenium voratum]